LAPQKNEFYPQSLRLAEYTQHDVTSCHCSIIMW